MKESLEFSNLFSPAGLKLEDRKEEVERNDNKMKFDEESHFKNKPDWLLGLYKKIDGYCLNDIKRGVRKTILQTYIKWSYSEKMFCRVFVFQNKLKVYLKLKYSELENPPAFIRDYSDIAKGTTIEILLIEEYLQNEEAFFTIIFSLIEKSFSGITGVKKSGPVKKRELKSVKTIEEFRPSSVSIAISENGYLSISLKIHKSKKELLNRILQETIFR